MRCLSPSRAPSLSCCKETRLSNFNLVFGVQKLKTSRQSCREVEIYSNLWLSLLRLRWKWNDCNDRKWPQGPKLTKLLFILCWMVYSNSWLGVFSRRLRAASIIRKSSEIVWITTTVLEHLLQSGRHEVRSVKARLDWATAQSPSISRKPTTRTLSTQWASLSLRWIFYRFFLLFSSTDKLLIEPRRWVLWGVVCEKSCVQSCVFSHNLSYRRRIIFAEWFISRTWTSFGPLTRRLLRSGVHPYVFCVSACLVVFVQYTHVEFGRLSSELLRQFRRCSCSWEFFEQIIFFWGGRRTSNTVNCNRKMLILPVHVCTGRPFVGNEWN